MKRVYFIVPEGNLKPSSLFAAIEVFEKTNEFCKKNGRINFYDIKIVGVNLSQNLTNSRLVIKVSDISKLPNPHLIIIPGLHQDNDYTLKKNKVLLNWLTKQYSKGAEIASLCTGAFLLAATGLADGIECSTHWKAEQLFIEMYPAVKLRIDKIITDHKGVYTAGGATSSLNLLLYLVEKYNGREAAIYCAKVLQLDIERDNQSQFIIFDEQKNHDDEPIKRVQNFIEKNVDEKITVESLSSKFSISKRSLVRRFKKATNNPPIEYIQRIRIEAAKRKLEKNGKSVNEIMYEVGYTDVKAFRTIFRKITGISPIEYRNKFNRDYTN